MLLTTKDAKKSIEYQRGKPGNLGGSNYYFAATAMTRGARRYQSWWSRWATPEEFNARD
jgi:hypothetical protein